MNAVWCLSQGHHVTKDELDRTCSSWMAVLSDVCTCGLSSVHDVWCLSRVHHVTKDELRQNMFFMEGLPLFLVCSIMSVNEV